MLSAAEFPSCLGQLKRDALQQSVSTVIPQPLADLPRDQLGTGVSWFHVSGQLVGNQVLIRRSGDIALLSSMGVFGTRLHPRFASESRKKRRCTELMENDDSAGCYTDEDEETFLSVKRPRRDLGEKEGMDSLPTPPPPLLSPPVIPTTDVEPLVLSSYEAFFLMHSVAMLHVFKEESQKSKPLSLLEVWNIFVSHNSSFAYHYAVYLFYRGKGWVPKHGLRVGADFTLYAVSPSFCHAAYSVRVQVIRSDALSPERLTFGKSTLPTMKEIMTSNRVANKVNKKLVICYVIVPEILSDIQSPKMVEQLKVKEVFVERFNPEKQP